MNSLDFNDESGHEQLQKLNQELLLELILDALRQSSSKLTNDLFIDFPL